MSLGHICLGILAKCLSYFINDRVRSTREGYVLTRVCPSVCLSTGGVGYSGQVQMEGGGCPSQV